MSTPPPFRLILCEKQPAFSHRRMSLKKRGGAESLGLLLGIGLERERIVVGAVGMWESRSDFQGRWETRETRFWFSSFPIARHFHSPSAVARRGLLAEAKRANSLLLACCIRRAAAVSLSSWAMLSAGRAP